MTTWNLRQPARIGTDALAWDYIRSERGDFHRAVRAATTGNIGDLSLVLRDGYSLDGMTLGGGDRVLVKDQTDVTENGVWLVGADSDWPPIRAPDFAAGHACSGVHVWVEQGRINGATNWTCVGTPGIVGDASGGGVRFQYLQAERTYYKEAVTVATVRPLANLVAALVPGAILDGVELADGSRVLVKDQANALENGIYVVGNPALRSLDMRIGLTPGGITVPVLLGDVNQNTMWVCAAGAADVVGSAPLVFRSPVVDAANGGVYKEAVHVATTANVNDLATTLAAGYTVDGLVLPVGVRVLVKDQTAAVENGIYLVTAHGAERTADMALKAACTGAAVFVLAGSSHAGRLFVCVNLSGSDVVGTDALEFRSLQETSAQNNFSGVITAPRVTGLQTADITLLSDAVNVEYLQNAKFASLYKEGVSAIVTHPVQDPVTALVAVVENGVPVLRLDGQELAPGDRVLLTRQSLSTASSLSENGIWVVAAPATAAVRAPDSAPTLGNPASELAVVVEQATGAAYIGSHERWQRMRTDANTVYLDPVRAATTHPLGGEPATTLLAGTNVDGVTLVSGDRVLVKNGADANAYGIWVAGDVAAARAPDARAEYTPNGAVLVEVHEGLTQAHSRWRCTDAGAWVVDEAFAVPWKSTVRAASATDVSLAGLLAGAVVDDITVSAGDRVLLMAQTVGVENGLWVVGDLVRPAVRSVDAGVGLAAAGCCVFVTGGTVHSRQAFVCVNVSGSDTVGTHALEFEPLLNHRIVPWLGRTNAFTGSNSFSGSTVFAGTVSITNSTAATSQTTGALTVSGGVGVAGNVFCTSSYNMSDERLKTDFVALEDSALDVVEALRGYEFTWNADETSNYGALNAAAGRRGRAVGVKAQEVQAAGAALCVHQDDDGMLAVDYTKLVPYLIESVKSLKRRVEQLEGTDSQKRRFK